MKQTSWPTCTWTDRTLAACVMWARHNLTDEQWIRFAWYVNSRVISDARRHV